MHTRGLRGHRKGTMCSPLRHHVSEGPKTRAQALLFRPCAESRSRLPRSVGTYAQFTGTFPSPFVQVVAECCVGLSLFRMGTHIELWTDKHSRVIRLEGERITLGKSLQNDLVIDDEIVSRLHAVFEHYPSGWAIRDLGSRNGTFINGDRLIGERALRPDDEIRLGDARLVFRSDTASDTPSATHGAQAPPEITRRERDVLLELCRPVLGGSFLTEPATVADIADALFVSDSAVKKHLGRLFDKFELHQDGDRRRGRLAAEAIRRGAVNLADIRQPRA